MAKRKNYKLKKGPKIFIIVVIILIILIPFCKKQIDDFVFKHSNKYAFLQIGYKEEDVDAILERLTEEEEENLLTYEYNEFIPIFIQKEYFMYKNLDGYLGQVITQEEDFFKYHGTEGYNYDEIVAMVNTRADEEPYENVKKTDMSKGYAILCNKYNELDSEYEPDDLVDISIKYYYGGAKKIRKEVYDAFIKMWEAANEEGIYLIIMTAYRDYDSQAKLYKNEEDYNGTTIADNKVARPGFSEYQTGLALDIYSKNNTTSKSFKDSDAYNWLQENSYKYGFILRYPDNKKKITAFPADPAHYRYIGVDLATKLHDKNITFDEYYAFYLDN